MIIQSLLDTDLYKFTMMQCVLHRFPSAQVEYDFKCRNKDMDLTPYHQEIQEEIEKLCTLRFSEDELEYLSNLRFLTKDFIDFLRLFQLRKESVSIVSSDEGLAITISGSWLHTILFEVPILSIVNEVYFRSTQPNPDYDEGRKRLYEKVELIKKHPDSENFVFSDFGTRRRFGRDWQSEVVKTLATELPKNITGTSNVLLAKNLNLTPVGTMAHEFLQACQALGPRLIESQKFALEVWSQEYRGDLGIALTDVIGIDAFLNDFDLFFSKLFDGLRHDSGDPIEWAQKVIAHYHQFKLDPKTKRLIFSDGLNVPKALEIFDATKDEITSFFGIGTNLTNDLGYEPLQIVIKMVRCNDQPVAKLSDSTGKTMCKDDDFLKYLRKVFHVQV
ncbi:MAG: nicotinate phosphoribosyltransferase [bacterium]|jgi:nicotinate phosphoribosyltransferase